MTSSRVAVTFVINNLDTNSKSIEGNIWSITKHFENPKSKFSGKKVIDEESKIINNNSAIVVFDMDSRELHHEGKVYKPYIARRAYIAPCTCRIYGINYAIFFVFFAEYCASGMLAKTW